MKLRKQDSIDERRLLDGDIIKLDMVETFSDGSTKRETVLQAPIDRTLTVNTAVLFDVEEGDLGAGVDIIDGIGGAFLNVAKKEKKKGKKKGKKK